MKKEIIYLIIGLLVVGLFVWIYRRFIYFPHAKVISSSSEGLVWTNGDLITQSTVFPNTVGSSVGTYSKDHKYIITTLPNEQFRFVVEKKGDTIVDNIISFVNPPEYLTK